MVRLKSDGTFDVVWRSEKVSSNLNPQWTPADLSMAEVCDFDLDLRIRLEVLDYNDGVKFLLIGETFTSVRELLENCQVNRPMELTKESKRLKHKNYVNSGILQATQMFVTHRASFTDVSLTHVDFLSICRSFDVL